MALRQAGDLAQALEMARADYTEKQDQWTASALFWVLKDKAVELIGEQKQKEAGPLVTEMESLVGEMGATMNVALEALNELQKLVIPHYEELREKVKEIATVRFRSKLEEIYQEVEGWFADEPNGMPHTALHNDYAQMLYHYLQKSKEYIEPDLFFAIIKKYLALSNDRPSELHSAMLKLVVKSKERFEQHLRLSDFLEAWNLAYLMPEDWQRRQRGGKMKHSLAERTLKAIVTEFMDRPEKDEVPQPIYQLLLDASNLFPDDDLIRLTQARINLIDGNKEAALESYRELLITLEEPRVWMELALLLEDEELQASALCMALREETNEYQDYLIPTRLKLARLLIGMKRYPNALRELNVVAQLALEKGLELPPLHAELLALIPEGTEQDRENRAFYQSFCRKAQEYIFQPIEAVPMLVIDVMAIRASRESNQILPMLKLLDQEGNTVLVNAKETGILPGDNRGLVYNVKLLKRPYRHTKALLMTLAEEQNPKKLFTPVVGFINGYSEPQHSFHVMDMNSRHHYLPGEPDEYLFGEMIDFILFVEYPKQKNSNTTPREYLLLPQRIEPEKGLQSFPVIAGEVDRVRPDDYVIYTDDRVRSIVPRGMTTYELVEGDRVQLRGFQQRHKDHRTGGFNYSFTTLEIRPEAEPQGEE